MVIGYQGERYSNSEAAARSFAEKHGLRDAELRPLVTSLTVVQELKAGRVDYGVVAVRNTLGGTVAETYRAIRHEQFRLAATEILPIHHCLFRREDASDEGIAHIASHAQALSQTAKNRAALYPRCDAVETSDTARAARLLAEGSMPGDTAVLCRREAGESYGLRLMRENMEDSSENLTEFRVFQPGVTDYEHVKKPSLKDRLLYSLISDDGLGYLGNIVMFLTALLSLYLINLFKLELWDGAEYLSGVIVFMFLLLYSDKLRNRLRYRAMVGYWKYYSLSDSFEGEGCSPDSDIQRFETPRLVRIQLEDGELKLRGYICDQENVPYFESTEVFISPYGRCNGHLVYWYSNPNGMNRNFAINGIVELNWSLPHPASMINRMTGRYEGKATGDCGSVDYLRISEEEYYIHRNSSFL